MTAEFDFALFPLYRINGQEWPGVPGLVSLTPPRRTARGREGDSLLVYLTLSGNTQLSSADYAQLTARVGQQFYQSAGSLTSAMRQAAESINQLLVERNLSTTGKGQYTVGRLILGVLRGSQFILAISGPAHVFHLGREIHHLHDPQIAGRGLGFGQTTPLFYSQVDLTSGDSLLLCASMPAGWEALLMAENNKTTLDSLRRKLLAFSNDDLNAAFVQVKPGKGSIAVSRIGKPDAAAAEAARAPAQKPEAVPSNLRPSTVQAESHLRQDSRPVTSAVDNLPASTPVQTPPAPVVGDGTRTTSATAQPPPLSPRAGQPDSYPDIVEIQRPRSERTKQIFRTTARVIGSGRRFSDKFKGFLKTFLPRLLPSLEEKQPGLSGAVMALIAVAIAVVVVTVSMTVYSKYGRDTIYQDNMQKAVDAFNAANTSTNPAEARRLWESTIYYVELAEKYKQTDNSRLLKQHAQSLLDTLDSTVRLDFQPALIVPLDKSITVSRMAATENNDLYLLKTIVGQENEITRAFITNQGYEIDPGFKCGPGIYGGVPVGSLIDLAALPDINAFDAAVLAIDANGTLLYCASGAEPRAILLTVPNFGWRGIRGFALDPDGKNLYVLDPIANAVWVYSGSMVNFTDPPVLFFGEQIPRSMDTAIDLAASGDDLFLLFQDGHVTSCTQSHLNVQPTRCTDPIIMQDNRLQHQPGPTISDAIFSMLSFAWPPDISIYMLEPNTRAIYQFSPRQDGLFLQGQYRADADFTDQFTGMASAFAISPNHYFFMCVGNQVYYATDVP